MPRKLIIWLLAVFCGSELKAAPLDMTTEIATASPMDEPVTIISEAVRAQFEREAILETKAFLNGMFQAQIDYFSKVKERLPTSTKRVQDIERYITRLQAAKQADDISQKDKMWRDTFSEFSESAFLINNKADTSLSNERYHEILAESGLEEVTKTFLADVAVYFWKMAKASGKVVEMTIDEQLEKWKHDQE